VRQAVFNILLHHDWGASLGRVLNNRVVLDAFAGTGALGIEALSQGAAKALFFEKDRAALATLTANITAMKIQSLTSLFPHDVRRAQLASEPASLLFLDPPYGKGLIEAAIQKLSAQGWIAPHALLVCETARGEALALPENCPHHLTRPYGDTEVHFLEWTA
jgi:16S rRNA (guanine966-N2)-methyltransferase